MDENKRQELHRIGYAIRPACWLCKHASFPTKGSVWGTCGANAYEHKKHSETKRELSIHMGGSCPKFAMDPNSLPPIHGFAEFVDVTG